MDKAGYFLNNTNSIITPALVCYKQIIEENTHRTIKLAGGVDRLWPHVKTHKMSALVKQQQSLGITRFKCATLAEAEMVAECGAEHILVAYPLVGPNILRFVELQIAYPESHFWAVGDDYHQLSMLAEASLKSGLLTRVLIDVNLGMDRTGVPLELVEDLFVKCAAISGLDLQGLHCFNGNFKISDHSLRQKEVDKTATMIFEIQSSLLSRHYNCHTIVVGSTPSIPCYTEYENIFLSPGTAFITDRGYSSLFEDLEFETGAVVLTRVISRAAPGLFTVDLGYKSIAADPPGSRGVILGFEDAQQVFHCEEHWTFQMKAGDEALTPEIGTLLYVLPTHICPTIALYPYAWVSEHGEITAKWDITARDRKITI